MSAIIYDTETTGFKSADIIEAAWLRVESPQKLAVTESFEKRYKPSQPIQLGALATHHILEEELEDCDPSTWHSLPDDIEYLIGHNIDFDWEVSGKPNVRRICTLALARKYFPQLDSHKQTALVYYFHPHDQAHAREMIKNAHSALADVHMCNLVLGFIIERIEEVTGQRIESWDELWALSEDARIPEFMTFGKHAGQRIEDVPVTYVQWYRKQENTDPYLIQAFKRAGKLVY